MGIEGEFMVNKYTGYVSPSVRHAWTCFIVTNIR